MEANCVATRVCLGAGLTASLCRKAPSDRPALKPYWGKPAVRKFREGDGNVGIIRSPVRAIALPDKSPSPDLERARGGKLPRATRQGGLPGPIRSVPLTLLGTGPPGRRENGPPDARPRAVARARASVSVAEGSR